MKIPDYCETPDCTTPIEFPDGSQSLCADYCISPELKQLWQHGIRTYCSCCGHGNDEKAYVLVDAADEAAMTALGYERGGTHECLCHENVIAFKAMSVRSTRDAGKPCSGRTAEATRLLWKMRSGLHVKE